MELIINKHMSIMGKIRKNALEKQNKCLLQLMQNITEAKQMVYVDNKENVNVHPDATLKLNDLESRTTKIRLESKYEE